MNTIMRHLFLLAVAVVLTGCTSNAASLDMISVLPVYPGAYDVDRRKLGRETNQQLSYKVEKVYPSTEVLDFYDQYLVEQGWKKCTGDIEEWQSFIDASESQDRLVHQIAHYFIKEGESKLGTVFLRYDSSWSEGSKNPEDDIQNVFILMQRVSGLQGELQRLSIKC